MAWVVQKRTVYLRPVNQELYMQRCLELAERGKGSVAPNPMVGAVLVHEDRIIGEGWHERYGEKHAEVNCLDDVAEADKHLIPGSTLYVNLEPCAHQGKQPPCALRIIKEGIRKVVIGNEDTFSEVNGRGIALLEDASIDTTINVLKEQGRWLNRRFFTCQEKKRPYIILKWAQSKEGNIAPQNFQRTQLSNAPAQLMNHQWRMEEDAILVGFRTALHDNPQLSPRLFPGKMPLRIVLDKNLELPATHHLMSDAHPTVIVNLERNEISGNKQWLKMNDAFQAELIEWLLQAGISSLIVEGGAQTINSFMAAGLWDEARVFDTAVSLAGGIAAPELSNFQEAETWTLDDNRLKLYLNKDSGFVYQKGMKL